MQYFIWKAECVPTAFQALDQALRIREPFLFGRHSKSHEKSRPVRTVRGWDLTLVMATVLPLPFPQSHLSVLHLWGHPIPCSPSEASGSRQIYYLCVVDFPADRRRLWEHHLDVAWCQPLILFWYSLRTCGMRRGEWRGEQVFRNRKGTFQKFQQETSDAYLLPAASTCSPTGAWWWDLRGCHWQTAEGGWESKDWEQV